VHVAVDDTSRLAYVEILDDENGATCVGFLSTGRLAVGGGRCKSRSQSLAELMCPGSPRLARLDAAIRRA
jgi:hypothetical protein